MGLVCGTASGNHWPIGDSQDRVYMKRAHRAKVTPPPHFVGLAMTGFGISRTRCLLSHLLCTQAQLALCHSRLKTGAELERELPWEG